MNQNILAVVIGACMLAASPGMVGAQTNLNASWPLPDIEELK